MEMTGMRVRWRRVSVLLIVAMAVSLVAALYPLGGQSLAARVPATAGPTVASNDLVDLDHDLAFPKNKQNEPAITRDPLTSVLIVGANDELAQPHCSGTTTPLASPCPFEPGAPISAYYVSRDNGHTWSGGYLPGFKTIGRASGGDPSL